MPPPTRRHAERAVYAPDCSTVAAGRRSIPSATARSSSSASSRATRASGAHRPPPSVYPTDRTAHAHRWPQLRLPVPRAHSRRVPQGGMARFRTHRALRAHTGPPARISNLYCGILWHAVAVLSFPGRGLAPNENPSCSAVWAHCKDRFPDQRRARVHPRPDGGNGAGRAATRAPPRAPAGRPPPPLPAVPQAAHNRGDFDKTHKVQRALDDATASVRQNIGT